MLQSVLLLKISLLLLPFMYQIRHPPNITKCEEQQHYIIELLDGAASAGYDSIILNPQEYLDDECRDEHVLKMGSNELYEQEIESYTLPTVVFYCLD